MQIIKFQKQVIFYFSLLLLLSGCAGKVDYYPPLYKEDRRNSATVDETKEKVWAKAVPALGKNFFVINNIDKDSGLINISYSGDPEKYIDCGQIVSYVKNARGEREYNFPAAKSYQQYEMMQNGMYAAVSRKMELEGRMNLLIEEVSENQCLVTANTRYVVTKKINLRGANGASSNLSDSISFNTKQEGVFEAGTRCRPTGKFEEDVITLVTGFKQQ